MKKRSLSLIIISVFIYVLCVVMMIVGTKYDLEISKSLFNPENKFAIDFELFSQFVYWGMWGPLATVLFLNSHGLNECLGVISNILPFIHTVKNTQSKVYKFFDILVFSISKFGFFIMAVVGWKKLIENIMNDFVELSQATYFLICIVVSWIGIFLFSRINKETLKKLELLALAGVLLGIFYKICEELKGVTGRIRFREMVAYSNDILREKKSTLALVSCGQLDGFTTRLSRNMINSTDFSAFTDWYKIAPKYDYYDHPNSFPSGHTTYSCTLFLSVLFCNAFDKLKKYTPLVLILSFIYVGIVGFSRIIAGAHYLTDVAGACIIGYTLFLVVYAIYNIFDKRNILNN